MREGFYQGVIVFLLLTNVLSMLMERPRWFGDLVERFFNG